MASYRQNRFRSEPTTLGVADVTNVSPIMVSTARGQVPVTK